LVLAFCGFIFSLFAKNANSPHHAFVLLPFFLFLAKCKPTHYLILLFFSVSHKSAYFDFYMGFSFMRKAQIPLQAIATLLHGSLKK
jgi:hypothetical protein